MNESSASLQEGTSQFARSAPAWSFEHAERGTVRGAMEAGVAGFSPRVLWRELGAGHEVRGKRLRRMVLVWMLGAVVVLHVVLGVLSVPPWSPRDEFAGRWDQVLIVLWPHGTTVETFVRYTQVPLLHAAVYGLLPMVLMGAGVALAARLARAEVAKGMFARAIAYGMASGLVMTLCMFLIPAAIISSERELLVLGLTLLYVLLLAAYPVWLGVYWYQFAKRVAGLPRPGVSIVVVVVVTVILTAVASEVFNRGVRAVFPSPLDEIDAWMEMIEQRRGEGR